MYKNPKISVIMSVLNGEKYLKEAIDSLLNQSFSDFEIIIINDGSTDRTEEIIKSYDDQRIIYLKNNQNLGLSKSFNIGIQKAQGEYIARMDADDICLADRFKKQISFFKDHPETDILGSSIVIIDENGKKKRLHERPSNHLEIKWVSLFSTPLYHSTVMAKNGVLKSHPYNENFGNSEDYELWSRLLFETETRFANIKEPLILHRVYKQSFTQSLNLDKRAVSAANTLKNLKRYVGLKEKEVENLVRVRQELPLTLFELFSTWKVYLRSAGAFTKKEKAKLMLSLKVYLKLFSLAYFLLKHAIKHAYS